MSSSASDNAVNAQVVRQGAVNMKEECVNWLFTRKWLVLKEQTLSIHRNEASPQQSVIWLRDIAKIERVDVKAYCLLLEVKDRKIYLTLKSDEELYGWLDDLYSRSPLNGVSNPTYFMHKVHIGFDPVSGAFTGMPIQWSELLRKSAITRQDYSELSQRMVDVVPFYPNPQSEELDEMTLGASAQHNDGTTPVPGKPVLTGRTGVTGAHIFSSSWAMLRCLIGRASVGNLPNIREITKGRSNKEM